MNANRLAPARTCLLLVGYTPDQTRAALDFCNRMFFWIPRRQRIMTANCSTLLGDGAIGRRLRGWQVTVGSNRQHEFSGWQEGLDVLRAELGDGFGAILVNDTVNTHRRFSLPRSAAFLASVRRPPAVGLTGFSSGLEGGVPFAIDGQIARRWVSSYLLFLGADALARVHHRVWYDDLNEACVTGGADVRTFFTDVISPNLSSHLRRWLFEGGWYRSESLSAANSARFTIKARSIINEIALSVRAQHPDSGITDPFEQFPTLARWDRRLKRWRMALAEIGSRLREQVADNGNGRGWRLR